MRILVCVSEYFPKGSGIANVAYNVVREWEAQGIDCTVCSPIGPDIPISSLQKCGYPGLVSFWERALTYFERHGADYDLVWLHNPVFLRRSPFRNTIVTIHTTSYGQVERKVHPWWLHAYYLTSTEVQKAAWARMRKNLGNAMFTTISDGVAKELDVLGVTDHPIVPNGVDTARFNPSNRSPAMREKLGIPPGDKMFLSVGRFSAQKKPLDLLEVFDRVQERLGNVHLVFVGSGELKEKAIEFVKEKGIKNVSFLGRVSNEDLPIIYAIADYYVMASVYEGQPLTVLEAMASGVPCIVSDIPSIDVVRKAGSGILVNYQDPPVCADRIVEYVTASHNHGVKGRQYAVDHLDWKIIARRYLDLAQERGILSDASHPRS
jgi:1,2-diacylglycerol 3-alpha-glucosyltransferase